MKDTGKMTRLMGREGSSTQMEMSMKATGLMTKQKASEFTLIWMELCTQGTGGRTDSMGRGRKPGWTRQFMRAAI